MSKNVQLLIIDPQNDFCTETDGVNKGTLVVPGAAEDIKRLSYMIRRIMPKVDDIRITLDSHHPVHIAHPIWWIDRAGNHPKPFTLISKKDVETGEWRAYNPGFQKRSLEYVSALEQNNKYVLVIWPPHCLIGGWGHNIVPELRNTLMEWENQFSTMDIVTKGSNIFTEHYSAVQSDVVDPEDATTMLNMEFIKRLEVADVIAISGQALSHCVANTVRDIADKFGPDNIRKFVLLTDACSNVPGFEKMGDDFIKDMKARGMQLTTTAEFLK